MNASLCRSASDAAGNWDKSLNVTDDGASIDLPDCVGGDADKVRQAIRDLQEKIDKTMHKLRQEQAFKEGKFSRARNHGVIPIV